jgi:hypothetical protein
MLFCSKESNRGAKSLELIFAPEKLHLGLVDGHSLSKCKKFGGSEAFFHSSSKKQKRIV